MLGFLFALVAFLPAVRTDAVRITIKPQQVFIEQSAANQLLNFDFLLENLTKDKLLISSIRVSVFDENKKLLVRRLVDQHGLSPSIQTIPKVEIEAQGSLYLFNPFYSFDSALNIKTLRYEFLFSSEKGQQYRSEVVVMPVSYRTKTHLVLPLKGRMIVEAGHDFYSPHRRIDLTHPAARAFGLTANSARYAGDLTISDENGELHRGTGERLADWYGYGAALYSPGAGRIVTLADETPDNAFSGRTVVFSRSPTMDNASVIFGNYVVIDHGNGEYSLFAHLKQGSFKVKLGETVKQGQLIAEVGFSGNTDFVHTHYQLQNGANPATAEGLPAYFHNFRQLLGSKTINVREGQIDTGSMIERE